MATVTEPIMTDATGQEIVDKLGELASAVKPNASDIPLTPPSGMTATNVQDGISELKQSFTDTKVTQTATDDSSNAEYEVLFSGTADNTTRTEGARKTSLFTFNPQTNEVVAGHFTAESTSPSGTTTATLLDNDVQLRGTSNTWDGTNTSLKTSISQIKQSLSDLETLEKTVSGAIVTFDDGSDLPMPKLEVAIEPQQEGSGDPSPTNIRPISGWDEVNVTRIGKNIWGGLPLAQDIEQLAYQPTLDTTNKTLMFTNSKSIEGSFSHPISNGVSYKENTQYTFIFSYKNNGKNNCLRISYTDGNSEAIELDNSSGTKIFKVFTTQSNKTIKDIIFSYYTNAQTYLYYEESGLFEGVLTAQDFEPYNGQTYNIQFKDGDNPLTVYGGSLDVVNGELTVYVPDTLRIKLSSMNWVYQDAQRRFYGIAPANIQKPTTNSELPQYFMCECYRANPYANYQNGDITITIEGSVFVKDGNYTDVIAWLNAVGDYYVTFSLATPITIQLTPTQVKSLLGVNKIFADAGNIELTFFTNNPLTQTVYDMVKILVEQST